MVEFILTAAASFVFVVMGLVLLHEFGHYLAGRAFGLIPKAFSVGMGPELAAFVDRHGTRWKLSALPLGGYVKFAGEMHPTSEREGETEPHDFSLLPRWKRAVIIAAGPATNLMIAAVILLVLAISFGRIEIDPTISSIDRTGAAYEAGLREGDRIVAWDGDRGFRMQSLVRSISMNPEQRIRLTVERQGESTNHIFNIDRVRETDRFGNSYEIGTIGLEFPRERREIEGMADMIDVSLNETVRLFGLQITSLAQIVTGDRSLDDLSGPLRMAKMSGEQLSLGWLQLAYFAAIVSIAIGFMNLLPVPGLDGGYLAIYAYESIMGRDLQEIALKRVVVCGYAILALLMVFTFTNDIRIVFLGE